MLQRVVENYLHYRDSKLIEAGCHSDRAYPADYARLGQKMSAEQVNRLEVEAVYHYYDRGYELSDDGGDSRSLHSPIKSENEHCVKYGVDHRSRNVAEHGDLGAAVRSDYVSAARCKYQEREAECRVLYIFLGVGHYRVCGSETFEQRRQERQRYSRQYYSADHKQRKCVSCEIRSAFLVPHSHGEVEA